MDHELANTNLERLVLMALIAENEQIVPVQKIIPLPEEFSLFAHQEIYACILELNEIGEEIDLVSLANLLQKRRTMEDVRYEYLSKLWDEKIGTSHLLEIAETVHDLFLRRRLIPVLQDRIKEVSDNTNNVLGVLDEIERDLNFIRGRIVNPFDEDTEGVSSHLNNLPLNALPDVLEEYITVVAETINTNPAYLLLPVLCAVGGVIGNSFRLYLGGEWWEPSVMWGILIAESGTQKSAAMELATWPIEHIEADLAKQNETALNNWEHTLESWKWKRKDEGMNEEESPWKPQEPPMVRLSFEDATLESLASILKDNQRGLINIWDEMEGWFSSFGRYGNGSAANFEVASWNKFYRGIGFKIDRKHGKPRTIYIPRACVSLIGAIQPGKLAKILGDDYFVSGMASRFLLTCPPRTRKVFPDRHIPAKVKENYRLLIHNIYQESLKRGTDEGYVSQTVTFTDAARKEFKTFYEYWADRQHASSGETLYCLSKLEAYAGRFCLMNAVIDHIQGRAKHVQVTQPHVKRSIELVKWFSTEADRVYSFIKSPKKEREFMDVISYIQSKEDGKVNPKTLFFSNKNRYGSVDGAEKILDQLVKRKLGVWEREEAGPKGGRPKRVFKVFNNN